MNDLLVAGGAYLGIGLFLALILRADKAPNWKAAIILWPLGLIGGWDEV